MAKNNHISKLGNKLNDPLTPSKSYWKIIHRVINRARLPVIPPILVDNILVLNCIDKCKHFALFFSNQCKINVNSRILPPLNFLTNHRLDIVPIDDASILSLIRNLNANKAMGPDGMSARMLMIADASVVLPLKIIYSNILNSSIYPDQWKLANVTPIHKKGRKQLVSNYRPISLHPICGKIFEKLIFNSLYTYLTHHKLITHNQSGFKSGDSTTNQLLFLVNEIHEAFENPKSLEVRAVFLDISKAFDKV